MYIRFVASPEVARILCSFSAADMALDICRMAASDEVQLITKAALAEAEQAGPAQDVVVIEGLSVMDWGYFGPWNNLHMIIHGSTTNLQLNIKLNTEIEIDGYQRKLTVVQDDIIKIAAGYLAEIFRQKYLSNIPPHTVAGYGYADDGGFSQANLEKLELRREFLRRLE